MKSNSDQKAEMEKIQRQRVEAKKSERANPLNESSYLCKDFGFTTGILKESLVKERGEK